ncbi:MAG: hypothetical protein JNM17_06680 [Archangium sp.]|nr:hypothetical protein [Archangium sp.]
MKYAENTSVAVAKSRMEIEQLVNSAGGTNVLTMALEERSALVMFTMKDRNVKFTMPLPARGDFAKQKVRGWLRTVPAEKQAKAWEQACRSGWRALLLTIKAKLISIESKVETFEEAFLPHIVVVNEGQAVRFGELAVKAIQESYAGGPTRPLLGSGQ